MLALSPASCGCTLALDQRLTISHGTTSHGVDARLEIDAASVDVALLAAGQVVGTLRWDGERLEAHAPVAWPQMVTPARVLSDLQLVWWPAEAVRNALPSSWTLVEGPLTRQLRQGGLDLVSVRYEGRPPGWQKVVLERPSRYTIEIESVEAP
ncbi:MAG: DUF3261 domain-containing protein [Myxococcaceae bacterium]|nr:DUF3261 domain-containing protein [Myxococcaceae bacterium]